MHNQYKSNIDYLLEIAILIALMLGIGLGVQTNPWFFLLLPAALVFAWLYQKYKREEILKLQRKIIKGQWGLGPQQLVGNERKDYLHKFLSKREGQDVFIIDKISWKDLNMDTVFHRMDHSFSLPGMQYLYYLLRRPVFKESVLEERKRMIHSFREEKGISQQIQEQLFTLGKEEENNILVFFDKGIEVDTSPLLLYKLLSFLPILPLGLMLYDFKMAIGIFILISMINATIYNKNKYKIAEEMDTFKILGNLIKCGEAIDNISLDRLEYKGEEVADLLKRLRRVKRNISKLSLGNRLPDELSLVIDYYNMLALREPKVFYETAQELNQVREDFLQLYLELGKIDAYIGLASYLDGLAYSSQPRLLRQEEEFHLLVKDLYHPLLEDPVAYSFDFRNRGALITGSNASGKSTFLRTIGINVILAQTIYTVLAKDYDSSYFRLFTSIGTTDSVVEGDSYFMAEAKALKRVLVALDSRDFQEPILCILDEIFRGTNTAERISAATAALEYLNDKKTCTIAATHDLELTGLLAESYDNYHFRETIRDKDMTFDYILREGPCNTRNALAILKYLGYPQTIYEKAMDQADAMEKSP